MRMTVAQLLERLTKLKHQEVIWGRVADFLHQFLTQDIGEPEKMTAEDCLIPNVPESEIEAILEGTVYTLIEEIEREVIALGELQVGNETKPKAKRKPAAKSRKAAGGAKPAADDNKPAVRATRKKRS